MKKAKAPRMPNDLRIKGNCVFSVGEVFIWLFEDALSLRDAKRLQTWLAKAIEWKEWNDKKSRS